MLGGKECLHMLYRSKGHAETIDTYRGALAKVLGQPLGEVYSLGHTQLMQFYSSTLELRYGLYEVARVCP